MLLGMDPKTAFIAILVYFWLAAWAICAHAAIKHVKADNSWIGWDLEDHLPWLVLFLLPAWPLFVARVVAHRGNS